MADEELPNDIWPDEELDDSTDEEALTVLRRNEILMNIHLLGRQVDRAMVSDFPDGEPTLQYSGVVGYKKRMLDLVYDPVSNTHALYMGNVGAGNVRPQIVRCEGVLRKDDPNNPGDFELFFEDPLVQHDGQPIALVMEVKTRLVTELKMGKKITRPAEQTALKGIFSGRRVDMQLHETRAVQVGGELKPPYRAGPLNAGWVDGPPDYLKPGVKEEAHD